MTPTASTATPSAARDRVEPASIDASCRVPLLALFTGAAVWIALASAFDLVASIKFHSPDFLADLPWLTYGRVHAAAANALLYGFALQAGFGAALWMVAQLGRTRVSQPWIVAAGGKIWNLGVLTGVIAILAGDSSGFENLEMPRYAAVFLLLGYLIIGTWTLLTLNRRHQPGLSAPQWFLLAALLWFPWIYCTANLLLLVFPVRGVEQSVIAWWYSGNLTVVWLSLVGLATIFYFLKISARPASASFDAELDAPGDHGSGDATLTPPLSRPSNTLSSPTEGTITRPSNTLSRRTGEGWGEGELLERDYRLLFIFWTLILFGSWVGIPAGAPVPAWMPTLSTIATVLTVIPLLTVAVIVYGSPLARLVSNLSHPTGEGRSERVGPDPSLSSPSSSPCSSSSNPAFRFVQFGIVAWLIAGALRIVATVPGISPFTNFTWFTAGQSQLNAYGFFAMTMFGAIYYMLPQVTGVEWLWPKAVRLQFWCAAAGILLLAVPLAFGGVIQGIKLNNPGIDFTALTKATLPFLRVSTLGNTLIFLSQLLLLGNLSGLLARLGRIHLVPIYRSATAEWEPGEVKS